MQEKLKELMSCHDAAMACGPNCCDDAYCTYVEHRTAQPRSGDHNRNTDLPYSAASQRRSVRYLYENMQTR